MLDLNSLLIFVKVADTKSFSEAARHLKMPVSTVSRRVAELEDQLSVRLLDRSTRGLRLTSIGDEVFSQARHGLDLRETIDNIVSRQRAEVSGSLRIASTPGIARSVIAPLVRDFQKKFPDVRLQVIFTERYDDQLIESIDLALRIDAQNDSLLVSEKILSYRHILVASPDYIEKHPELMGPEDLLHHRLLTFTQWEDQITWRFTHDDGRKKAITFRPAIAMNDFAGLSTLLLNGGCIGSIPPIVHPELLDSGSLVEVLPHWHFRLFSFSVVYPLDRPLSRAARLFKDFSRRAVPALFPHLPS